MPETKTEDMARGESMGDSSDSPTAGSNTLTPAFVTPESPLPWRAEFDVVFEGGDERCMGISAADGEPIVTTDCGVYGPDPQDARYIVHACNLYPELLDTLRRFSGTMRRFHCDMPECGCTTGPAFGEVDALLAKCAAQGSQE